MFLLLNHLHLLPVVLISWNFKHVKQNNCYKFAWIIQKFIFIFDPIETIHSFC